MQVQAELQEISSVKKKLIVEVPAEQAEATWKKVANDYRKHARLPGFRKGKAPLQLVMGRFQGDIRSDVLNRLVPDSYKQILDEKGIRPLGQPSLENLKFDFGGPLTYEARFEVAPTVPVPKFKGLKVTVPKQTVTDEDVDAEVDKLCERQARLETVAGRPAAEGDFVLTKLHGEDVRAQADAPPLIDDPDVTIELGGKQTHEAFSNALVGMQCGDKGSFEANYRDDYPEQALQGKTLKFSVEILEIKEKVLPDLDDAFAAELGDFDSVKQLREKIREELERNREAEQERSIRNKLLECLVTESSFEVPDILVEERIDDRLRDLAVSMASQGVDPTKANIDWKETRAQLRPQSENDVRATLILDRIAEDQGIEVTQEEFESEVSKLSERTAQAVEKVRQHFREGSRADELKGQIRRNRILELIQKEAEVVLE